MARLTFVAAATVALAFCAGGCVEYRAAPISAAEAQAAFSRRTLADPVVQDFVRRTLAHGVEDPADTTLPAGPATTAAATQPDITWDLKALTRAAWLLHPDMETARAHLAAVAAGEITAGEMPNPSVAIAPEFSTNPGDQSPWVVAATFDVPIETAGKRERRREQARALTDAARWDMAQAAWQVRSRLRVALAEYVIDRDVVAAFGQEIDQRKHYVAGLEARFNGGEIARFEYLTAQGDLLAAQQDELAAQTNLETARAALAAAIGMPTRGLDGATITWGPELPHVGDGDMERLQREGLTNRLDVRGALAEYAAAEAAVRLEIAKQYPDIHIGPGYTFDQGQNKWQLGVSMELPILNQNMGAIAEALGHRRELAAKFLAMQAAAIGQLEAAGKKYTGSLAELDLAQRQAALGRQAQSAQERALEAGNTDRPSVLQQSVLTRVLERQAIEARRRAWAALGDLEDAVERPIEAGEAAATQASTSASDAIVPATAPTTAPAAAPITGEK